MTAAHWLIAAWIGFNIGYVLSRLFARPGRDRDVEPDWDI